MGFGIGQGAGWVWWGYGTTQRGERATTSAARGYLAGGLGYFYRMERGGVGTTERGMAHLGSRGGVRRRGGMAHPGSRGGVRIGAGCCRIGEERGTKRSASKRDARGHLARVRIPRAPTEAARASLTCAALRDGGRRGLGGLAYSSSSPSTTGSTVEEFRLLVLFDINALTGRRASSNTGSEAAIAERCYRTRARSPMLPSVPDDECLSRHYKRPQDFAR